MKRITLIIIRMIQVHALNLPKQICCNRSLSELRIFQIFFFKFQSLGLITIGSAKEI